MNQTVRNGSLIAFLVILLDQATKFLVTETHSLGFVSLTPVQNTGGALGLFQGANTVFIILSLLILGVLVAIRDEIKPTWTVYALIGAGIGNIIDRILFGHVRDFISIGAFPVFNVADAVITTCAVVILLYEFQNSSKSWTSSK